MKLQIYTTAELENRLKADAKKYGVNVQVIANDILNKHYGLIPANALSDAEIEEKVLGEIATYVADENNTGTEFDLNLASHTYSQLDMTYAGKPAILKARLGRAFARQIGTGKFKNVEQVFISGGKPKRSVGNRAALYVVKNY